jgi:hypothetical protein
LIIFLTGQVQMVELVVLAHQSLASGITTTMIKPQMIDKKIGSAHQFP